MTQILSLILRKLRQPRVIAEVLGGILLGPTAFGRIPGFSEHIFPAASVPYLSLVANIGLCLFLFLVGLEIDTEIIKRNARLSATVAMAGVSIPFGMGAGLAVPLYKQFIDASQVKYTHFMLFTGVAYSITAFPVLCRILTELKLLDTTVGIVVLSAGVGNDIIGWVLLALSVALVNAGSGLTALWILLICVGWTLVLLFPIRRILLWLARQTGSVENGPTIFFMTMTILLLFGSAFFTDVIGVHAIFGAFLAGLVVPREGGLAIALTEKLEDMVSIIFLPLYFTLSGLSTDLGLLNTAVDLCAGLVWGYTVAICALAFTGKFGGCTIAARLSGFNWREASTIGSLMSCKGLIELIVLNVGLSAGILTPRVFSMFVLEALLLTFMTTPCVTFLYPPEFRTRVTVTGPPLSSLPGEEKDAESPKATSFPSDGAGEWKRRFTVVLDKIEHLPGMMALTQLIQPPPPQYTERRSAESSSSNVEAFKTQTGIVNVDALRLIELEDRTSAVMKSSVADSLIHTDPLLSIFRTFGELNDLPVNPSLSIVPYDALASSVAEHARVSGSQLVFVPWVPPSTPVDPAPESYTTPRTGAHDWNPFEALFRTNGQERTASVLHSHFIRGVFAQASTDVALFVDTGVAAGSRQHLFLPFFGGPDDRLALEFVVQLCANPRIQATVVKVVKRDVAPVHAIERPSDAHMGDEKGRDQAVENSVVNGLTVASMSGFPDTVYGNATTQTRMQSETADSIAWSRYASPAARDTKNATLASALSRIDFQELSTHVPLHAVIQQASDELEATAASGSRLLIIAGRSRRLAVENHHAELKKLMEEHGAIGSEVKKTVGDVATAFILSRCNAGLVVMQAATTSLE
ncbi:hypothetical protein EW146_g6712 [Bondarzewia mesenterica]|uniref:Cation/H+ exchanger transmembrane domain-containing protein n=1 Tax=Bondarzewia mesenterica TaxID=1095465 RepID=A0A4S4LMT1_9AGAM|nr:hypothetical protein EW146_g6712 [Bondarzewia mesenterica]